MGRKLKQVAGYVEPEVAQRLQEIAEEEQRTVSNLIAVIVTKFIKDRDQTHKSGE